MANTTFFGALGLSETDESLITRIGERNVYEAAAVSIAEHNSTVFGSLGFILEDQTEDWKENYKYSGGGRLQRLSNRSRAAEIKSGYAWDVGYPLENFGAAFAADRVTYAHMTLREFDRVLTTVYNQDVYVVRDEMLKSIFNNTTRVFKDDLRGDINVRPLANGDTVVYPPLIGTAAEIAGTSQHYLATASNLSVTFADATDPFPAIVTLLEGHFGIPSGGSPIVVFMNSLQVARAKLLTAYNPVINSYVTPSLTTDRVQLSDLPNVPGRVFGVHDSGAILSEWPVIPNGYLFGLHLNAPKPLKKRRDMAKTGLPVGLALVSEEIDHPMYRAEWIHRFGFGVGNRLNGVVYDLITGTSTYTIPTAWQ